MIFEWDEDKNQANFKKHKVSFELASLIFHDPYILSVPDRRFPYPEERWQSLGLISDVVLYVAHLVEEYEYGEEKIRIISARKATSSEERRYYANRST